MGKLFVLTEENCAALDSVADAVYKLERQKINLYVDLSFVSADEIKDLNKQNRGVDAVTDVLSFPMLDGIKGRVIKRREHPLDYDEDMKAVFLGSVAICREKINEQAKEYGHSVERETAYLFAHSLFHLFGYDHMNETDKKEMREREERVMNALGITR